MGHGASNSGSKSRDTVSFSNQHGSLSFHAHKKKSTRLPALGEIDKHQRNSKHLGRCAKDVQYCQDQVQKQAAALWAYPIHSDNVEDLRSALGSKWKMDPPTGGVFLKAPKRKSRGKSRGNAEKHRADIDSSLAIGLAISSSRPSLVSSQAKTMNMTTFKAMIARPPTSCTVEAMVELPAIKAVKELQVEEVVADLVKLPTIKEEHMEEAVADLGVVDSA